jgi:hypothetical protein
MKFKERPELVIGDNVFHWFLKLVKPTIDSNLFGEANNVSTWYHMTLKNSRAGSPLRALKSALQSVGFAWSFFRPAQFNVVQWEQATDRIHVTRPFTALSRCELRQVQSIKRTAFDSSVIIKKKTRRPQSGAHNGATNPFHHSTCQRPGCRFRQRLRLAVLRPVSIWHRALTTKERERESGRTGWRWWRAYATGATYVLGWLAYFSLIKPLSCYFALAPAVP